MLNRQQNSSIRKERFRSSVHRFPDCYKRKSEGLRGRLQVLVLAREFQLVSALAQLPDRAIRLADPVLR